MPPAALIAVAAGTGIVGAIAGGMKDKTEQTQTSGMKLDPKSALETAGENAAQKGLDGFGQMVDAGPGASDVSAYTGNSRSLADMLQQYSQTGGMPGEADINASNGIADKLFGAQRLQMAQNFQDQGYQANQQAALMGRSANDPILRNKLMQEQTRQQAVLQAQQGGMAQQLALALPGQRLGYAQQQNQVLGGLASQALANRQMLASMGTNIMSQQQNFRVATAQRYGTQSQESGGGLKGAITGGLAGIGTGLSIAGMGAGLGGAGAAAAGTGFNMTGNNLGSYFSGANPFSSGLSMPAASPGFGGMGAAPSGPSLMGNYVPLSNQFMGIGK